MPPPIKNRVGEKFITNEGYEIEIIECINNRNCSVQFKDGTIVSGKEYADLKKGNVKNPFHKSVYGVGYYGQGKYFAKNKNGIHTKEYITWRGMIERCYSEKAKIDNPSYKDCTATEEWHNFQNFGKWFEENYNPETMENWHLDKDILIKDNKIYSPETCCFVPNRLNSIFKGSKENKILKGIHKSGKHTFIGVYCKKHLGTFNTIEEAFQAYKTAKEKHIKEVAEEYKNQINTKVYQALLNYQVEITD